MYLIMLVMIPQIHPYAGLNWFEHDTFLNRPSSGKWRQPEPIITKPRVHNIIFINFLIFSALLAKFGSQLLNAKDSPLNLNVALKVRMSS